jgi:exopolysaccharide production protein ExoQ
VGLRNMDYSARRTVTPTPTFSWCTWFVAIAALFFLQITQTLAATIFVAATMAYVLARPEAALKATTGSVIPWTYPVFALLSLLWSEHPDLTLRGALEFAFTTGAALVMARTLPLRSLLTVYLCAILAADAASLIDPRMAWNTAGLAMIGIFGSKNSFALTQGILILVSTWTLLDREHTLIVRMIALIAIVGGTYFIISAKSVDAIAGVISGLICSLFVFQSGSFPIRWRAILFCFCGILTVAVCALLAASTNDFFLWALQITGKDVTLTYRTALWNYAETMISQHPILGIGYEAFWVAGNPYAEDIWMRFDPSRHGFHFHNLWYQSAVELGYVGLALAILIVAATALGVVRWAFRSPNAESCFFLSYVVFIITRSFLEVDLFTQFAFTWVLFVAAWVYARQAWTVRASSPISSGGYSIGRHPSEFPP